MGMACSQHGLRPYYGLPVCSLRSAECMGCMGWTGNCVYGLYGLYGLYGGSPYRHESVGANILREALYGLYGLYG